MQQLSPLQQIKTLDRNNHEDVKDILTKQMQREVLKEDVRNLQITLKADRRLKETLIDQYLQREWQRISAIEYLVKWKAVHPELDSIRLDILHIRFQCLQKTRCYTQMPCPVHYKAFVLAELKAFGEFPILYPSTVVSMRNFYPTGKKQRMS